MAAAGTSESLAASAASSELRQTFPCDGDQSTEMTLEERPNIRELLDNSRDSYLQ